jgi:hypothetical protein
MSSIPAFAGESPVSRLRRRARRFARGKWPATPSLPDHGRVAVIQEQSENHVPQADKAQPIRVGRNEDVSFGQTAAVTVCVLVADCQRPQSGARLKP